MAIIHMTTHDLNDDEYFRIIQAAYLQLQLKRIMDEVREEEREKMKCKYNLTIPNVGVCCKAYYESIRPDGLGWMHFPICDNANCPLTHSELLEGAILESENKDDNID